MRRTGFSLGVGVGLIALAVLLASLKVNPYLYFAGYVILQYVVIATAWNILGGYAGYVNFGTPAFFALGAYTAVFLIQTVKPPLPVLILAGGLVSALLGLGIGYLTLRLRGVFFSIATLALAIVLQTMIVNWEYVGGSRGMSVIRPTAPPSQARAHHDQRRPARRGRRAVSLLCDVRGAELGLRPRLRGQRAGHADD